ncbi:MAG: DNA gyrase inhibitor YacG [Deltaproteobacteria bacterium]|nr:DNA gyrase inhibitor YacG [Deltaproteobacteria bacterium]
MHCPICKKIADARPANRYRPFCSERCQTIDLGLWAVGEYKVPGKPVEDREHPDDRRQQTSARRNSNE